MAVQVALVEEAGLCGDLGGRTAALQQSPRGAQALREDEPMRRNAVRGSEQPREAMAADAARRCHLGERQVAGEVVAEQARTRAAAPGRAAPLASARPPRVR